MCSVMHSIVYLRVLMIFILCMCIQWVRAGKSLNIIMTIFIKLRELSFAFVCPSYRHIHTCASYSTPISIGRSSGGQLKYGISYWQIELEIKNIPERYDAERIHWKAYIHSQTKQMAKNKNTNVSLSFPITSAMPDPSLKRSTNLSECN